jgi:hypothetical protein
VGPIRPTTLAALRTLAAALAIGLAGCAAGGGGVRADGGTGGELDARVPTDAGSAPPDVGLPPTDASGLDAGPRDGGASRDAGPGLDSGGMRLDGGRDAGSGGAPLDPALSVPPAGNEPCTTPGSFGECSGVSVCRFFDADEGRCESCTECGNLGASCASGDDCDILFACYAGTCTNICPLGTSYCGPVEDCLDVGHPTHGVCRP